MHPDRFPPSTTCSQANFLRLLCLLFPLHDHTALLQWFSSADLTPTTPPPVTMQWEAFRRQSSSSNDLTAAVPALASACSEAGIRAADCNSTDPMLRDPVAADLAGAHSLYLLTPHTTLLSSSFTPHTS